MKSRLPKALHALGGRPMVARLLDSVRSLQPDGIHIVHHPSAAEGMYAACPGDDVTWVRQEPRLGTGHAVQQAMPGIPGPAQVLVVYADHPLLPATAMRALLAAGDAPLRVLTMRLPDPSGYGRILRDAGGRIIGNVEHADASEEQRLIDEVNTGILLAAAEPLRAWLDRLRNDNRQGEYYLPDIYAMAAADGVEIASVPAPDPRDLQGANDPLQLALLERRLRTVNSERLMQAGVRIVDPARVELRGNIEAGMDVTIDVNVVLEGEIRLGDEVSIGPGCVLRDCDLAAGTRVHPYSVMEGVRTTGACDIGPFARLRPGSELAKGARVGNFVEVKQTTLGQDSKANHLSYLGDSEIGERVNIGAGTITCNYDGANKHRTVIGDGAFIGSDTQLVAPVTVGPDATIGAGSTITRDAPAGQLTVSRAKQVSLPGWKRPAKKPQDDR